LAVREARVLLEKPHDARQPDFCLDGTYADV